MTRAVSSTGLFRGALEGPHPLRGLDSRARERLRAKKRGVFGFERGLLVVTFAAFFVAVVMVQAYTGEEPSTRLLAMLAIYLLLLALPFLVVDQEYSWLHPVVFASVIAFITLIRHFPAYAWGLDSHQVLGQDHAQLQSLLAFELFLTALGLLSYYVAFALSRASYVPKWRFSQPRLIRSKVIATVLCATAVTTFYVWERGGLAAHFLNWQFGRHEELSGTFYFIMVASVGLEASLIWWALDEKASRSVLFWACAVVSLGVSFVLNGSRANLIHTPVLVIMIQALRRKKLPYGRMFVAGTIVLIAIADLGEFRRALWEGEVRSGSTTVSPPVESMLNAWQEITDRATTSSGSLPVFSEVPDRIDYLYGTSYLAVLALPVPRSWWDHKPRMIGGEVGELFFRVSSGVPITPVAEAYWNFGVGGVLLVFAVFGVFHRWLLQFYDRFHSEPAVMLIYAITLMQLTPSSPGVVDCLMRLIPIVALLWVFGAVSTYRRPAHILTSAHSRLGFHPDRVPAHVTSDESF
jgi:hypothetical protein